MLPAQLARRGQSNSARAMIACQTACAGAAGLLFAFVERVSSSLPNQRWWQWWHQFKEHHGTPGLPSPLPSLLPLMLLAHHPCHHSHCLATLTLFVPHHPHCCCHCPHCYRSQSLPPPLPLLLLLTRHPHCHRHPSCNCPHHRSCCSPPSLPSPLPSFLPLTSLPHYPCRHPTAAWGGRGGKS